MSNETLRTYSSLTLSDLLSHGYSYDGSYSILRPGLSIETLHKIARGCYQECIASGTEAISGSTLTGKAASYGGRYADSAYNFLTRCKAAGIEVGEVRGPRGKRILVFA